MSSKWRYAICGKHSYTIEQDQDGVFTVHREEGYSSRSVGSELGKPKRLEDIIAIMKVDGGAERVEFRDERIT